MGKERDKVLTYEKLSRLLEGKETIELKRDKITARRLNDYQIAIKLYGTDIITVETHTYSLQMLFPSSSVLGAFLEYSPARIVLKDLQFFILRDPDAGTKKQNLVKFFNGITVYKDGCLCSVNVEGKV